MNENSITFDELLGLCSEEIINESLSGISHKKYLPKIFGAGRYYRFFENPSPDRESGGKAKIKFSKLLLVSILAVLFLSISVVSAIVGITSSKEDIKLSDDNLVIISYKNADESINSKKDFSYPSLTDYSGFGDCSLISEKLNEDKQSYQITLQTEKFGKTVYMKSLINSLDVRIIRSGAINEEIFISESGLNVQCIYSSSGGNTVLLFEKDGYINYISIEKITGAQIPSLINYLASE